MQSPVEILDPPLHLNDSPTPVVGQNLLVAHQQLSYQMIPVNE